MNKIKKQMLIHESHYSKYACLDKEAIRLHGEITDGDIRPNYFRDIDRIIHSLSYTRYIDKTQVFSNSENDNISKRMTHVQMVSKIARTISRALGLNEDLTEAIALGHDLGHVPFGHTGERILNDITLKKTGKMFNHNINKNMSKLLKITLFYSTLIISTIFTIIFSIFFFFLFFSFFFNFFLYLF